MNVAFAQNSRNHPATYLSYSSLLVFLFSVWELAICLLADDGEVIMTRTFFSKGDNKLGHLSIYNSSLGLIAYNSIQVIGGGCGGGRGESIQIED